MSKLAHYLIGALALVAVAWPAAARPINVPAAKPVVSVDIPAGWKTSPTSRGVEVRSPDEEIFFWVEVYIPAQLEAVRTEHETYFERQGVKITGPARKAESKEGRAQVVATDFPATWKGKPTVLRYLAIDPSLAGQDQILISYWASPEGDKEHGPAFSKIIESLADPK